MIAAILSSANSEGREEGWLWWFVLVAGLVVVLLALLMMRRRLVRPLAHTPTDTTDAWAEAGRRLKVPPKDGEAPGPPGEKEPP